MEEVTGGPVRQIVLTDDGVRFLVRHLRPDQRPHAVRRASALYQPAMLRAWKEVASPAERDVVQTAADELYGDLVGGAPDTTGEFERIRAEELVLSWSRESDPDVRRGLARAMMSLGLRPLGEVDEVVSFDARHHVCDESLFPGDPARIVAPGWQLLTTEGVTLLQKAVVEFREDP